jgi:signal transduction histidine kinase
VLLWPMPRLPESAPQDTPDRIETDERLEQERLNVDRALAEQKAAVQADADTVIERAREHADAVLSAAREKADDRLHAELPNHEIRAVIKEERKTEDRAVERERAAADEILRREREQNARDLLALLPFERLSTDRSLMTERERADDAVATRDEFLAMVSHDLRDLLGGIVTAAAILLRTAASGDAGAPARSGALQIQRHAARMKRLIEDLTDMVSIDAGKLSVAPVPGDLAPVLAEAVAALRGAATAKRVSIELPRSDTPMPAIFDAGRVLQVLTNLIANAIKFTPQGELIRITHEYEGKMAKISVVDSGPGIAPELIEAIFERFRQVAATDERGLGLGLYIARTLVEAQSGKIWAESSSGRGARFCFTLPACDVSSIAPVGRV